MPNTTSLSAKAQGEERDGPDEGLPPAHEVGERAHGERADHHADQADRDDERRPGT
jgi:hypothetical protein